MIELLSVACLSVASKFTETSPPLLQEIQVSSFTVVIIIIDCFIVTVYLN